MSLSEVYRRDCPERKAALRNIVYQSALAVRRIGFHTIWWDRTRHIPRARTMPLNAHWTDMRGGNGCNDTLFIKDYS